MKNITSFLGAAGVAAIAALGLSTAALADEDKFGYSITIAGTSDYLFRGISLTSGDPAFQPFIEFTYGNPNLTWYLDFWGSNVKDRDTLTGGNPLEIDIYAGVRPVVGPFSFDFGVLYYMNPFASSSANQRAGIVLPNGRGKGPDDLDYVEFKATGSITPVTNLTLALTGYVTPDQGKNYPETETVEFDPTYTLPAIGIFTPTLEGNVGYTHSETANFFIGATDYTYWGAGVKVAVDKYFMDFHYWDTSISKHDSESAGLGDTGFRDADARFVFTAGVNLP